MMELLKALQASGAVHRLGWTLLHTIWLGAGIASLFAVALLVLRRRSANARYLAGCAALATMVLVPVVIFFAISPPAPSLRDVETAGPAGHFLGLERAGSPSIAAEPAPALAAAGSSAPETPQPALLARATQAVDPALPWVVLTWASGVLVLSFWQLGGWIAAGRLKRSAARPPAADLIDTVARLARAMGVSRPVKLLRSALVKVPTVVGWLRPVILLPAGLATGLSPKQLQAILAHELAHIRRYDYLVNLLQSLAETVFFYHPAAWFISRRIRAERENCCDDIAVAAGAERVSYAESLLHLARESVTAAGRRIAAAPALAAAGKPSQLRGRIRRLLGAGCEETSRFSRGWPIGALLAAALAAGCLLAEAGPGPSRPAAKNEPPATQAAAKPRKAFLPNAAAAGEKVVLDLATGQMLPHKGPGAEALVGQFDKLGKGDLAYGREGTSPALACLRYAGLRLVKGKSVVNLEPEGSRLDAKAYRISTFPFRAIISTTEGAHFDVTVLSASKDGASVTYKMASWRLLALSAAKSALKVLDVRFDPIGRDKNTLHVKVSNTSDQKQTFAAHIYTRRLTGWGQVAFATLEARQTRQLSFPFVIHEPVTDQTYLRLRFYNPPSAADFDFDGKTLLDKRYRARQLERRAAAPPGKPASEDQAREIRTAFLEIQSRLEDGEYKRAWGCFTKEYQRLVFWRYSSFQQRMNEDTPRFYWSRPHFLQLRPQAVTQHRGLLRLAATRQGKTWSIDFVRHKQQWKIDWVRGYTHRVARRLDWQERLLPSMQKHTTAHFDVYCFKGSTAAKEIDRILKAKEAGYQEICDFLGKPSKVRIRLVLFEDKKTKHSETGHQGMGWATGTTIVEVYGDEGRLDPYHETAHILMRPVGNPPAVFNEGFATYMSERLGAAALKNLGGGELSLYAKVKQIRTKGQWIPLRELLTYTEIGSRRSRPLTAYPQAGAFVKFLIDKYGKAKFLQAYQALSSSSAADVRQQNRKALERIYAQPLERLEQEWVRTFLSAGQDS